MKKRSLCFKYGNFSAVLFALALGLASCHLEKKTGTAPNSAIKTEDISWEEKSSAEGCKVAAAYPTDNSSAVAQNIREWMNEQLGGTYAGSLDDGKKLLEYYGTERAEKIKKALVTLFENDCSSARPEGSMQVCRVYWWKHDGKTPKVSSAKIHNAVQIKEKAELNGKEPNSVADYDIILNNPEGAVQPEIIDNI